jgi:Arc/MetJ-type ribon-helix-helix transcriptional regulator
MSSTIQVPDEIVVQVRELIEAGKFPDQESAVREAFRLLAEQHVREQLWAKLEEADRRIEQGEFVEWNEETRQRIKREGRAKYERGHRPKPDVCPPSCG